MVEVAVIKVAAIKSAVIESAAIKGSAMRDEGVMVVHRPTAMPVVPPVTPAPTKPSEEPETKSDTEGESDAAPKNPGHGIPAGVGDDRRAVDEPGIIGRHVDHLRVGRFDDDGVALSGYLLLFVAIQMASLASLLTHGLDGIGHILRLAGIGLAKGGRPGEVLVHVFKNRGELRKGFYARIPGLFVDFFGQLFTLEVRMGLHPAIRLDNLGWIGGSGENLRNEGVRVQGDRRHELLQFLWGLSRRLGCGLRSGLIRLSGA